MGDDIQRLWEHTFWADTTLLDALRSSGNAVPAAHREYAHIIGAEEVWLARVEQRPARAAVWPDTTLAEMTSLLKETQAGYRTLLGRLNDAELSRGVTYTNSAGQTFTNTVRDILLHVAMHGQYHRGKVNLLLRQAGQTPAATDYIAFVRGVPAATRPVA